MNTKDKNAAPGSFNYAANTAKWPPCPYGSPRFAISQLNCGSKVPRCLFCKAPGLQHGIHVSVSGLGKVGMCSMTEVLQRNCWKWSSCWLDANASKAWQTCKRGSFKGKKKRMDLHISSSVLPLGALALHLGTRPLCETRDADVEMKDKPDWFIL